MNQTAQPDITIIETKPCDCDCDCSTRIAIATTAICRFCFIQWHRDDPRRYQGAFITAGLSNRTLRTAHINQLMQHHIPCGAK